jgi:hypothetical protein
MFRNISWAGYGVEDERKSGAKHFEREILHEVERMLMSGRGGR